MQAANRFEFRKGIFSAPGLKKEKKKEQKNKQTNKQTNKQH
jgi:hypothetical protein